MFLGLPSFFSFLEGATCGLAFPVTCKSLETTRATFLEILSSSVDTPGSGPMSDMGHGLIPVTPQVLSYYH